MQETRKIGTVVPMNRGCDAEHFIELLTGVHRLRVRCARNSCFQVNAAQSVRFSIPMACDLHSAAGTKFATTD